MRKAKAIALITASVMLLGHIPALAAETYSLNALDKAAEWQYIEDAENGISYYTLEVVYCEKPVLAEVQKLKIYAPSAYLSLGEDQSVSVNPEGSIESSTGVTYTAQGAPIVIHNTSGGYSSSTMTVDPSYILGYLGEGYVAVEIATRGKEVQNADGEYIGQFPNLMVDMKAGIRYLKANDEVLPGSSERIISRGFSSGGAVSAMLGASGNAQVFAPYLEEIGAADASDDIFIALASAPITNLSSADASYEWYHKANDSYWLFNAMAFDREGNDISDIFPVGRENIYPLGSNILGGGHEDELSALLYNEYVSYVQGLGFDLTDDGRGGEFYDGLGELYSEALNEFLARYDELRDEKMPETVEEYIDSLSSWVSFDPVSGKASVGSLDDVMVNLVGRNKMCPSLDSYNYRSNENSAFTAPDGTKAHFSPMVRDALKTLLDDADAYGFTEEEVDYLELLYQDYEAEVTDESARMLEVMSPINYILGSEGFEADVAPFWRLRVGSKDGDHGVPAAWLLAHGLESYQPKAQVSIGIAWNSPHSLSELTEQDLYDYIAAVMATVA